MTLASRINQEVLLWGQMTGCGDLQPVLGREALPWSIYIRCLCQVFPLSFDKLGLSMVRSRHSCFLPMVYLFSRSGLETWVKARLGGRPGELEGEPRMLEKLLRSSHL